MRSLLAGRTSACPTAVLLIWSKQKEMIGRNVCGKYLKMELRKRVTAVTSKNKHPSRSRTPLRVFLVGWGRVR